ncbi:MAG: carboxypeptidase-like regulatory domain-containing protein, partial [Terriglobia bacterium]
MRRNDVLVELVLFVCWVGAQTTFGQAPGSLQGTVTLSGEGMPVHGVDVRIVQLGRTAESGENGRYQFDQIPPGT